MPAALVTRSDTRAQDVSSARSHGSAVAGLRRVRRDRKRNPRTHNSKSRNPPKLQVVRGNYVRRGRRLCGPGFRDPGRDIFVLRTETESPGDYRQLYGGMESGHSASRATPAFASLHIYSRPVQPLSSSDDVSSHCRPGTPGYLRRYVIRMDCGNTNRKGAQMAGTRHTSRCGSGEDDVVRVAHPRVVLGGKRLIQSSPRVFE